ncbi:MAG TPA: CNNM domain-containing protein [Bacteroidales bacterium]|mgnify:CR=1 FL=1|nr:CNNM domain-containing protein [Bacteroidales bacterium]HRS19454.1 CNNM domain-containing protein [Bacteroidales bacterium]
MTLLLVYLFLALSISFLCSIMEAVLLSTPQSFIMTKKENRWSKTFLDYKKNIDKPLSAILTLNTVAHTVGAAGVGAQASIVFGDEYFGLVSAILTILILVLTEIIPKTIGANYWRNLTTISAIIITSMYIVTYPLVLLSALITKIFTGKAHTMSTSREEISAMASIGADQGIFSQKEHIIIQNIIKLKNVKVSEIMTPRVVLAIADENLPISIFLQSKHYLKYSRIPIYCNNEENITGYVFRQTVFEKLAEDKHDMKLKDIRRDIVIVHNSKTLFTVWENLLERREHIALVVDEYGGVDGIVTMEDIIETMLGLEIIDEKDTIADMQSFARERWKLREAKYSYLHQIKDE